MTSRCTIRSCSPTLRSSRTHRILRMHMLLHRVQEDWKITCCEMHPKSEQLTDSEVESAVAQQTLSVSRVKNMLGNYVLTDSQQRHAESDQRDTSEHNTTIVRPIAAEST